MAPIFTDDQLSSIAGYMSISCWIVVYTPQIWENYLLQSGEGLSVGFIILWLLGDITNLVGGVMAHLLPTMIIIAVYYSLCDLVLLYQVYYYRWKKAKKVSEESDEPTESSLLLNAAAPPAQAQPKPLLPAWLQYPLLLLFVLAAGVVGWYLDKSSDEVKIPEQPGKGADVELEWKSQTLGWLSAFLYLGSRLPQIKHNYKTRCAGLSLAMFFFSILGNMTYVSSILFVSFDGRYILANASWLAGSGLTILLDLFVLAQFAVFSIQDATAKREAVTEGAETAEEEA